MKFVVRFLVIILITIALAGCIGSSSQSNTSTGSSSTTSYLPNNTSNLPVLTSNNVTNFYSPVPSGVIPIKIKLDDYDPGGTSTPYLLGYSVSQEYEIYKEGNEKIGENSTIIANVGAWLNVEVTDFDVKQGRAYWATHYRVDSNSVNSFDCSSNFAQSLDNKDVYCIYTKQTDTENTSTLDYNVIAKLVFNTTVSNFYVAACNASLAFGATPGEFYKFVYANGTWKTEKIDIGYDPEEIYTIRDDAGNCYLVDKAGHIYDENFKLIDSRQGYYDVYLVTDKAVYMISSLDSELYKFSPSGITDLGITAYYPLNATNEVLNIDLHVERDEYGLPYLYLNSTFITNLYSDEDVNQFTDFYYGDNHKFLVWRCSGVSVRGIWLDRIK